MLVSIRVIDDSFSLMFCVVVVTVLLLSCS